MAKRELRSKAIDLRKNGMSYSEIKQGLGVSKSTLSIWLKDLPLTTKQLKRIKDKRSLIIEKYRNTMAKIRQVKHDESLVIERKILLPLNHRDLMIGGLFLYWGEGGKTNKCQVNVSNSDPGVLLFAKSWLSVVFGVPSEKMRVRLSLYDNMSISSEILYWSNLLNLPSGQFRKIQVKKGVATSNSGFGHGTCELVVTDTKIKTKIMAGLQVLSG